VQVARPNPIFERHKIRDDIHEAFLSLACGIICWRRLASMPLC
jgi:hypothetical protein